MSLGRNSNSNFTVDRRRNLVEEDTKLSNHSSNVGRTKKMNEGNFNNFLNV